MWQELSVVYCCTGIYVNLSVKHCDIYAEHCGILAEHCGGGYIGGELPLTGSAGRTDSILRLIFTPP
jgi:hypothetical protein